MLNTLRRIKRRLEKLTGYVPKTPSKAKLKAATYKRLGISADEILRFKKFGKEQQQVEAYQSRLLGRPLTSFNNYFWYFHSIEELFVDEVYKCELSTDAPYILDCGANIGLSVIYFKQHWPKSKIVAFEPDPKNFDYLTKNIESFQLTDVIAVKKGVWKESTSLKFFADGHLGGTVIHSDFSNTQLPDTQFVRLRDYLDMKVDFLKIDIEGAEYEVLKDARDKLVNVEYLFVEFHGAANQPQKLHEMLLWISEAGFRYHIKFAHENQKHPFIEKRKTGWDLQLNIFCYR